MIEISSKMQRLIVKPWALPVTAPAAVIASFVADLWKPRPARPTPVVRPARSHRITVTKGNLASNGRRS